MRKNRGSEVRQVNLASHNEQLPKRKNKNPENGKTRKTGIAPTTNPPGKLEKLRFQSKPEKQTGTHRFRNRRPEKPEKTVTGKRKPDQEVRFSYDSVMPWPAMI